MPSASNERVSGSTERTCRSALASRRRVERPARSRNRLDVSLASPAAPAFSASAKGAAPASCAPGVPFNPRLRDRLVEKRAAHRITPVRDVPFREDDLEEMRAAVGRPEHFRAAVEIDAPDAPEALVEPLRVDRVD